MKFECIIMSVILWLNIVGNRKISRCRSIERALFFQQRDEERGVAESVPFISPTPFLDLRSVSHPMPTARRMFSAVGQTPRQPRDRRECRKEPVYEVDTSLGSVGTEEK